MIKRRGDRMTALLRRARYALITLVPAMWSSNYIIARSADGVIAPHLLASGRWLLAGALLMSFLGAAGLQSLRGAWRGEWRHTLVLGVLGMYICGAWVYQAGKSTSSANIALIFAVTPEHLPDFDELVQAWRENEVRVTIMTCHGTLPQARSLLDRIGAADAVMLASALLRRGPELLGELTDGLSAWLTEREYASIEQLKGSMSQESCGDSRAFERAQYVRAIVDYQLRGRTIE